MLLQRQFSYQRLAALYCALMSSSSLLVRLPPVIMGVSGFQLHQSSTTKNNNNNGPTITSRQRTDLLMVQNRGLEVRREGATPTEGGMTLYLKAGPDGKSVGDCPFTHFVRMVLEEKGLEYDLMPSVQETKPAWLIEHYGGKMPALRHRKECYVESDVIAEYLDFFFPEPPLKPDGSGDVVEAAETAVAGIFPAIAKYLKHTPDGDDDDLALKAGLEERLSALDAHLAAPNSRKGPFLVGDGEKISLMDCSLAPKLFHMQTGITGFKNDSINLEQQFPNVATYMNAVFERPSFVKSTYPKETVLWGWGNARA